MTWPITDARIAPDAPVTTGLMHDMRDRVAYIEGISAGSDNSANIPPILNGSFELDTPGTTQPNGWTFSALNGGSGSVSNSDASHGTQCFRVTHPGGLSTGGGVLTAQTIPVSVGQTFCLGFETYATNPNIRMKVDVGWYDYSGSIIGGSTFNVVDLNNGAYPATWTPLRYNMFPIMTPSRATLMKIAITLGAVGTDPGASTNIYIDNVSISPRTRYSESISYLSPGTYNWTCPAGIYDVMVLAVGGGAQYVIGNNITNVCADACFSSQKVTPGKIYTVVVGVRGWARAPDGMVTGQATSFNGLSAGGAVFSGDRSSSNYDLRWLANQNSIYSTTGRLFGCGSVSGMIHIRY